MAQFLLGAFALLTATFFIVRRIAKLPSRYERQPKTLSPWNALDQGVDPSIPENPHS